MLIENATSPRSVADGARVAAADERDERRLRILMVAARCLPFNGGTETHVDQVSRRLSAAGHRVGIVTADPTGALQPYEEIAGVGVTRLPSWPKNRDYCFAPGLLSAIKWSQWDLVHIQGYHTLFAPTSMMAAINSGIPFVVTFHSGGHSSPWRQRIRPIQWTLLRPLVSRAHRCIAVSRFEAESFSRSMRLDKRRIEVIPNGAELPAPQVQRSRSSNAPLILSVGRLERYKGHHRAIEALPHLLRWFPDARLQIVGSGPYESELRALAESLNVDHRTSIMSIAGADRQALSNLLAQSALVTLLSDYEANPVAVMEALSIGCPVLTTHTSGFIELAEQGFLRTVPHNAAATEIADTMACELSATVADRPVFALPDWQTCTDRLMSVYRDVVREQHRPLGR